MSIPPMVIPEHSNSITLYERDSGRIIGSISSSPDQLDLNRRVTEHAVLEGHYESEVYFVSNGKAVRRPELQVTLQGTEFSNIPLPATLSINGKEYVVNESTVSLTFDQPGAYILRLESWPYLPKEFTIEN